MWWLINLFGLLLTWHYMDLESDYTLLNTICPLLVGLFSIGLLLKVALALNTGSGRISHVDGGGGGFSGGFGGGDGGCGGDGGGC
jgi:hypothetical protein